MKKLLTFISSFSLISGVGITAVSCSSVQRFKDVSITDELASKIIYGLQNDPNFNFNNGNLFYKNLDYKNKVIDMMNEKISLLNYKNSITLLNQNLGLSDGKEGKNNETDSEDSGFERNKEVLSNLATFNLFNEYTTKRLESRVSIDETDKIYRDKIHPLNPITLKINGKEKAGKYAIYFKSEQDKWLRWQMTGEFDLLNSSTTSTFQIPSIELLTNLGNNFRIGILDEGESKDQKYITNTNVVSDIGKGVVVNNGKRQTAKKVNDSSIKWYQNVDKKNFETNGEGIMKYRFAYYFKTRVESKLFSDLLGSSYLDSKLYEDVFDNTTASSRKLILNGASQLISNIQTNFNQQTNTVSNVKMVWALSTEAKNITKIDQLINECWVNGQRSKKNKLSLKSIYEAITSKKNSVSLKQEWREKIAKNGLEIQNESKQGSDPFLALSGFNGFVQNDKETIKSLNGDLKISDDAKKDVSKINTPIILTNNGNGYDSDVKGNKDVVFVLPIYLNDIFSTSDIQIQKEKENGYSLNILENTWTDMSQKFDITDKANDEKQVTIKKISNENSDSKVKIANKNNKWYVKLENGQEEGKIKVVYNNEETKTIKLKKIEKSEYKTLDVTKNLSDSSNNKDLFSSVDSNFTQSFISYDYNIKNFRDIKDKQNSIFDWYNSDKSSVDVLSLSAENKQTLLDQLKSIISNNDDVKNAAKTELYNQYLNSDQVKYQELFDEISKFIRDDQVTFD